MAITGDALKIDGIGHFLSDNFVRVPFKQRSYMWEKDNVEDFWNDITHALDSGEDDYFIGSIVMSGTDGDELEVVDGQQRLATTTIILAAIRDYYAENGNKRRADTIEAKYLLSTNDDTLAQEARLTLNVNDHVFFDTHVVRPAAAPRNFTAAVPRKPRPKPSNANIAQACEMIRGFVRGAAGSRPDSAEARLQSIVKYIRDHVKAICVKVANHENAYTIFETLNDRGLDLTKADLLKNHLLRAAGRDEQKVESHWSRMSGGLEAIGRKDLTVEYVRNLWMATRGHIREKDLYKTIRQAMRDRSRAVDFANELADSAPMYSAILNSDHSYWDSFGDEARADLANLILLGMPRLQPITLSAVRTFNDKEVKKALYYLVCASVRLLIAGAAPGEAFDNRITAVATSVSSRSLKTAKDLAGAMNQTLVPGDTEFEQKFAGHTSNQAYLARYYLLSLENSLDAQEPHPARVLKEQNRGTIEHVLPENPSAAWSHIHPDVAKAYHKRIGNLALLKGKDNSLVGNEDFLTVKVPVYARSNFALTRELAKLKAWHEHEIDNRQKALAARAVKVWPITVK